MRMPFTSIQAVPGAAPGIEHEEITALPASHEPARITCMDYCPTQVSGEEITSLDEFLARHRPDWSAVRWINVAGLGDMGAIHALATKYDLHPLAIEDLLHVSQRPKIEPYGGEESEMLARLFIVARFVFKGWSSPAHPGLDLPGSQDGTHF